MATLYHENDIDPAVLDNKTVAVAGYGEDARAHALNLRDSGISVLVAAPAGTDDARRAAEDGFAAASVPEAAAKADIVAVLAPEAAQAALCEREILPNLAESKMLLFAHGFTVHYGLVDLPDTVDAALLAPRAPGRVLRAEFERGAGVPCLAAVHRDFSGNALKIALAYGRALGGARAGILESTFAEETESALFAAQAVLAGGVPELLRAAFDTLVDNGVQPEAAHAGLVQELALCLGILRKDGPAALSGAFAATAEYGGCTRGQRIVGDASRDAMQEILSDIRNGAFAREWLCENLVRTPVLRKMRERAEAHPVEAAAKKFRSAGHGNEQ